MPLEAFAESRALTLGVELELQIVNTHDFDLSHGARDLLRLVGRRKLPGDVKPEMTDSMIELSTGVCADYAEVLAHLRETRDALVECAGLSARCEETPEPRGRNLGPCHEGADRKRPRERRHRRCHRRRG